MLPLPNLPAAPMPAQMPLTAESDAQTTARAMTEQAGHDQHQQAPAQTQTASSGETPSSGSGPSGEVEKTETQGPSTPTTNRKVENNDGKNGNGKRPRDGEVCGSESPNPKRRLGESPLRAAMTPNGHNRVDITTSPALAGRDRERALDLVELSKEHRFSRSSGSGSGSASMCAAGPAPVTTLTASTMFLWGDDGGEALSNKENDADWEAHLEAMIESHYEMLADIARGK